MDIDELTLGQVKALRNLFDKPNDSNVETYLQGEYVIVRTYSAGVFAGTLEGRQGDKILLKDCRRLWRWSTANNDISLSGVATEGLDYDGSKICIPELFKVVSDIEISPCSDKARLSIEKAPNYVA